jgi:hypothetical protein
VTNSIRDRIAEGLDVSDAYAGDDAPPLAPYATLAAVFNTGLAALLWRTDRVPKLSAGDVVMMTVATHKLSRTITKDKVTAFVRAPFTKLEGPAGHGELDEKPRGEGARRAVGELLTCPYCIAMWVGGGFLAGMALSPRRTRAVAALFTTVAGADALHLAYRAAGDRT